MVSPTRQFVQISQLIENARSITDLNVIITQLIPLSELKKLLLNKLSKLEKKNKENDDHDIDNAEKQNNNDNSCTISGLHKNKSNLSLHSLYFNSYPFDEIFNDDIICSVIQLLSGSNMYNKLMVINKNFNRIMKENPILYQQYKIQVALSDDIWSELTQKLYINISHQLQCIEISSNLQHTFVYNTAIPLNSKNAPEPTVPLTNANCNNHNIIIDSVDAMTNKCPFMWYAIKKWQIITHLNDYDNGTLSTPTFATMSHPTTQNPSPISNKAGMALNSFPEIIGNNNNNNKKTSSDLSLMDQLLMKASTYIRSIQIDERIMSASPTGGIFGMYGLYTQSRASSNLYLNYNHELHNKKKHIASNVLKKLISLNSLTHIQWITDESAPILTPISINRCSDIQCLDLCGTQGYTILNNQILTNLDKLLVISIEFDDLRYISSPENNNNNNNNNDMDDDNKGNQDDIDGDDENKYIIFPANIEFIQLKSYDHASDIMLDLSNCCKIIAMQLTISTKSYKFSNMLKTIKWPSKQRGNKLSEHIRNPKSTYSKRIKNYSGSSIYDHSNYLIECLLIEYTHKSMSPSHDLWHQYCKMLTKNNNNKKLPVRNIRCITNSYSHPLTFKMGPYNDSVGSTFSTAETVDHFTYTNLIKGLESNEEINTNQLKVPSTKLMSASHKTESIGNINDVILKGNTEQTTNDNTKITKDNNNITDNSDGDGILWKQLIFDKYKRIYNGDDIAMDKILMYKKYFDMDIVKWIYHLGRDYGSTSMGLFDTSSFNNVPDISSMGINDRSTISNNIILNPQYIHENENRSSSSAVFIID